MSPPAEPGSDAAGERAKAAVRAYYDAMNGRDPNAVMACYTDDARTWVLGTGPYAGWHDVSRETLEGFFAIFDMRFTILSMIAEGEVVACEVESEGTLSGKPYANRYHNRLRVRDGRIAELKEYYDTALAGG